MYFVRGAIVVGLIVISSVGAAVERQQLIGTWQSETLTKDGATESYPARRRDVPPSYLEGSATQQFQITEEVYRVVGSDELAVVDDSAWNYSLQGDVLTLEGEKSTSQIKILNVTADSMVIGNVDDSDGGAVLKLKRIPESELAVNKLQPIPVTLNFQLYANYDGMNKEFAATYRSKSNNQTIYSVGSCLTYQNKPKNFAIYMSTYRNTDGRVSSSSGDPGFSLQSKIDFNWDKPEEVLTTSTLPSGDLLKTDLLGTVATGGKQFRLTETGTCELSVHRKGRALSYEGSCKGVQVTSARNTELSREGVLHFSGNCIADFM